ncbi:MAG TPA: outer membrane beta-barrel family protein [Bacteroidales bacterium]|nr:outer membrane beta-barrel family protein [Bacteroidales bacterium]
MSLRNCRITRVILFIFIARLALAGSVMAQVTTGTIAGKVFDNSSKDPLEYATIAVINSQTGKVVTGTVADAKGNFKIASVPAGTYKIEIDFIGYEKNIIDNVKVGAGGSTVTIGQVFLNPSTHSLSSVVVTADKPLVENKIDKIVYNASIDVTSQGGLAIDVLKKVPQVTVDIDGNVELQGNSNIRFLINGKPSSVFGNNVADALASIPASQIKSIEAITNPGAKYDSQGTGGIINIILQDNKMQGVNASVNLSAGTRLENSSANLNIRHNNFGINAFFSGNASLKSKMPFSQTRVSSDTAGNKTTLTQSGETDVERNGFRTGLGFDWSITKSDNLIGSVGFNQFQFRNSGITDLDQLTVDPGGNLLSDLKSFRNSDSWMRFRSLDASLEYKKKFRKEGQELDVLFNSTYGTPHSQYTLTQTYNGDSYPYMGSSSLNPGTDREIDISVDYSMPVKQSFTMETGVKSTFHDINSIADASKYSTAGDIFIPDPLQSYNMNYNMNIFAGYISGNVKLFNLVDLKAGVRYEHTDVSIDLANTTIPSYGTIVPSTVLSYNLSKTSSIKLSYSRRIERADYRSLNPFMNLSDPYNISTGNPRLKPEYGNNLELGYSSSFPRGGNIYFSVIERINTQDVKQMTTFYPTYLIGDSLYTNVSVSAPQNIGEEYNTGISASGSYPITKMLNIRGSLMMTHRYSVSNVTGNLSTGIRARLNMNLTWQLPKDLVMEAFGNYNAPSRNIQGKVPQFFIYSFAFRKMFMHKNASFGFTATNFLSEYVRQVTTITTSNSNSTSIRQMPFRSFGISFTYKFGKIEFSKNNNREDDDNSYMNQNGSH